MKAVLGGRNAKADEISDRFLSYAKSHEQDLKALYPNTNIIELLALLKSGPQNAERADFLDYFQNADGTPNAEKIAAFNHLNDIYLSLRTYAPVYLERQFETEQNQAKADLKQAITDLQKAGYSLDDVVQFLKDVKISKSFTVHPTEHHNELGIEYDKALVAAHELPEAEKDAKINEIFGDMLQNPIGAVKKNSIKEEAESSNTWARIHNDGVNALERYVGDVIEELYHERPDVKLDMAPRSWDYDSDGKNNAEGWAMMGKMATSTFGAFEDTLGALSQVPEKYRTADVAKAENILKSAADRLAPILEECREITQELADMPAEERQAYYMQKYEDFQKTYKAFSEIYNEFDEAERGWGSYNFVKKTLNPLRKELRNAGEPAYLPIDNAFRTLRRTGLVLEKGQPRQNDLIHQDIIQNFFDHIRKVKPELLSDEDWARIDRDGGVNKLKNDKGENDTNAKNALFKKITAYGAKDKANRKELKSWLYEANPLSFEEGGNGYPLQTRTLLDRFELRKLYEKKFDLGIISDAGDDAVMNQKLLADIFGLTMRHMPLYEDGTTLSKFSKHATTFNDNAMRDILDRLKDLSKRLPEFDDYYTGRDIHDLSIMAPCSDSKRKLGTGALMEICHHVRQLVHEMYFLGKRMSMEKQEQIAASIEVMIGGGLSQGRFGGDVGIFAKIIAQELKELSKNELKRPFDHRDKFDRRLMRMAKAVLYTEQGRSKRFYTATSGQVADDFARRLADMARVELDLTGKVPDNTYIPAPYKFTNPLMKGVADKAWGVMIKSYEAQRFKDVDPNNPSENYIIDHLANKITCPILVGYLNNGARPGAKKTGNKKMTGVRAIENDKRNNISELFTSGDGLGKVMLFLQEQVDAGKITQEDIKELFEQPEWKYLVFDNEVANALRRDFDYAEKQLNKAENVAMERAYLQELKSDHAVFVGALEKLVGDLGTAFPMAKETADESKYVKPALELFRLVEDYLENVAEDQRDDAIKKLGGQKFLRQLGSSFNAGTASHWPLFSGYNNIYEIKKPEQGFDQLLALAAKKAPAAGPSAPDSPEQHYQ